MRHIKVYGTLGPACADEQRLREMLEAGMDGIRLNLSHGDMEQNRPWIDLVDKVFGRFSGPAELIVDIVGPELRIGELETPVELAIGDRVRLCAGAGEGITVPEAAIDAMETGLELLMDDGKISLKVECTGEGWAQAVVTQSGVLQSRKSLTLQGKQVNLPALSDVDKKNLQAAAQMGVTGVMQPFVRGAQDVRELREQIQQYSAKPMEIFAKIENWAGIDAAEEIADWADEVVIARGDLGASVSLWQLPVIQKQLARRLRAKDKRFMVATQILNSMIEEPVPTRAEATDAAQAVFDGAASVILTAETAVGKYPVDSIRALRCLVDEAAKYIG